MKYTQNHAPLICYQSQSTCYRGTKPMEVKGILWHSTGANNPNLSRYIQPSDTAALRAYDTYQNKDKALSIIGINKYKNDMNHIERNMGMNAWIGKLADGSVATVQTMPWDWKPWGCGAGSRGSCNDGWIQFETCEDALSDPTYAMQAYQESVELTAYLCKMFNIDPHGYVVFKGVKVPTILDHRTSNELGLGNNHGDIAHWYPKFGKNMETARDDVAALLTENKTIIVTTPITTTIISYPVLKKGSKGEEVKKLQTLLTQAGYDVGEIDGHFGAATELGVKSFQTEKNLTVDGIAGTKTWAALEKINTQKYIVTIKDLTFEQAQELENKYPHCEIINA